MEEFCNARAGGGHMDLRNACRQVTETQRTSTQHTWNQHIRTHIETQQPETHLVARTGRPAHDAVVGAGEHQPAADRQLEHVRAAPRRSQT
eukprot:6425681-Prymnesium_polylepis.1